MASLSNKEIAETLNMPITKVEHWFRQDSCFSIPDECIWFELKKLLKITNNEFDLAITTFEEKNNVFEKGNRIYDSQGICPTITCLDSLVVLDRSYEMEVMKLFDIPKEVINDNERQRRVYSVEGISPTVLSRSDNAKIMKVKVIGQMDNTIDHTFESANRVYDVGGVSPTINTCGGGGLQPKIIDDTYANRQPRVYEDYSPALRSEREGLKTIETISTKGKQIEVASTILAGYERTNMTGFNADNGVVETVRIKQATSQGYIECEVGGVADLSYPESKTRRGRVQEKGQVSPTLMAGEQDICKIEKEVEYEEGFSFEILRILRREIGEKDFSEWSIRGLWCVLQEEILRQNVYAKGIYENWTHRPELFKFAYNSKGNKYSIHSEKSMRNMWEEWTVRCTPQRRGLSEQQCREFDDFMSKLPYEATQRKRFVYCLWKTSEGIGLLRETLSEIQKVWEPTNYQEMQRCTYRIRKLTPLSCWRLMDFADEDFEKAAQVNSNTQLYKQAGNSIAKNVLVAILGQMIPGKENIYKEN